MEKMPYQPHLEPVIATVPLPVRGERGGDWRFGLPALNGLHVTLRELRRSDAPSLFAALSTEEVARFISPPPTTVEGFECFIAWTHQQRDAGRYVCFGIVPRGDDVAVGLFQIRMLESDCGVAEWGFALAHEFWGSGLFEDGARLVVDFAFRALGIHRLEARATVRNGRGNGALKKIGAVHEGVLRRSFLRAGEYLDQALWSILRDDWQRQPAAVSARQLH